MKRVLLTAGLLIAPLLALADVSGTWTATFDTQIGEQKYTYEFKVDGMSLTGMAKSANPTHCIPTITFVENMNYQGMPLVITYKGTIKSDNEIAFTRMVGEFATEELVAHRKMD